jgi:predicted O-methyltransferase YrrM
MRDRDLGSGTASNDPFRASGARRPDPAAGTRSMTGGTRSMTGGQAPDRRPGPSPDPVWPADIDPAQARERLAAFLGRFAPEEGHDEVGDRDCHRLRHVLEDIKDRLSMLHFDVLVLLYGLAGSTAGAIVEIGAYVGGATVAMAYGKPPERRLISLEIGGAHDHETLPSRDIFLDLQRNLLRSDVFDQVLALNADARDPEMRSLIGRMIAGTGIGLLVIDADGDVARDLANFRPYLRPGCVLAVDDYFSEDHQPDSVHCYPGYARNKDHSIKPAIDALVAAGVLVPFGLYGFGTWFGRLA